MARRVLLAAIGLIVAGCTTSGEGIEGGLLAIVDASGDVSVLTETGEPVAEVTELPDTASAFQPIWSGAEHLVFVERVGPAGDLVVASRSGDEQRRVAFATAPFYAFPRPGSGGDAEILALRNDFEGGLAAEIVHPDETVTDLGRGAPFYATWTDAGALVAHVGNEVLDQVYPELRPSAVTPGAFGAPSAWGDSVVYVRSAGSSSFLSVLDGEEARDLASVAGPAHLVVGGDRVAVRPVPSQTPAGGIEIRAQRLPLVPPNTLMVLGLEDGSAETVATGDIAAFFWDPSGMRLLYLEIVDVTASELAWRVWQDGQTTDFPAFELDPEWWVTFAQFFDQYAQSMTLWSPDGSAFAYPGRDGEEPAVWVQRLDADSPTRVASGSWVAWGPAG